MPKTVGAITWEREKGGESDGLAVGWANWFSELRISGHVAGSWKSSSERRKLTFIVHLLCLKDYAEHLNKSLLEAYRIFMDREREAQQRSDII